MKQSSRVVFAVLGLAVLAIIVAPPSHSAGGPDVTVVNVPLPVQGTVGVNNFPAIQAVSGNVNATITGTPSVNLTGVISNTISNPLLVQPVTGTSSSFWSASPVSVFFGGGSALSTTILNVNPYQVAVITAASARCNIDNGTNIQYVDLEGTAFGFTDLQYQTSSLGASEEMTSTLSGQVYVDGGTGGTSVTFTVQTNKTQSTPSDCDLAVSGYYLNESH